MKTKKEIGFNTACIHEGFKLSASRSHLTPIYASSTYLFDSADHAKGVFKGEQEGLIYGRFGSPTSEEVEAKIAALEAYQIEENGQAIKLKSILHASGMGAISTMFSAVLKQGDKVLTHLSLYGGTQELLDKLLPSQGIEYEMLDFQNLELLERTLSSDSSFKLVYIETPANPNMRCVDIKAISAIAKKYSCLVACDNTFATPYLQQPFALGADFVMHSTTKFLNGHGTAIGGVLVARDNDFFKTSLRKHHLLLGANSNGFDAFLLNSGIKTLALRMDRHSQNAQVVAEFLEQHEAVKQVNYLGLKSHPDFSLAAKQMRQAGGMMSFELMGGVSKAESFIDKLGLCSHAVSLGTCDTLISHPYSTTHFGVSHELKLKGGISEGLIRMSVGLEDANDIIEDLDQALNA